MNKAFSLLCITMEFKMEKIKKISAFFLSGLLWISIAKAENFCSAYPQYMLAGHWQAIGGNSAPSYCSPKYVHLTDWVGKWPHITLDSFGAPVLHNGGIPQLGNLAPHLAQVEYVVNSAIPDPNFDGVISIDQERWNLNWGRTTWHPHAALYKQMSRDLVRTQHPSWTDQQIEAQAIKDFEAGAKLFVLEALKKGKAMRPRATWAFYNAPNAEWWDPSASNGIGYSVNAQAMNDSLSWLWTWLYENQGAYGVSLYLHRPGWVNNPSFFNQNMAETQRLMAKYGKTKNIPFIWTRYHPSGTCPVCLLDENDFRNMIRLTFDGGADGLVHYITHTSDYSNYATPIISDIMRNICAIDYTIVAGATEGGQVNPSGSRSYDITANAPYHFLPDPGFQIHDVRVDGKSVGPISEHTFNNLRDDHTITALFTSVPSAGRAGFNPFGKVFNPVRDEELDVHYFLTEPTHVTLTVFSRLGRKIKVLVDEYQDAGDHNVRWDGLNIEGRRVSSGAYNLLLKSDTESETTKVVIIK